MQGLLGLEAQGVFVQVVEVIEVYKMIVLGKRKWEVCADFRVCDGPYIPFQSTGQTGHFSIVHMRFRALNFANFICSAGSTNGE